MKMLVLLLLPCLCWAEKPERTIPAPVPVSAPAPAPAPQPAPDTAPHVSWNDVLESINSAINPATEWKQIGGNFGRGVWAFGIDTSKMPAGACVQREIHDGQWLAGPCRDIFLLMRSGVSTIHLGAYAMANTERKNWAYGPRFGVNVGQVTKVALLKLSQSFPYIDRLFDARAPRFLVYLDKVLTIDYGVGYRPVHNADVIGNWTYGPMVKLDLPLDDVIGLLKLGL